jgi:hypothetical protein
MPAGAAADPCETAGEDATADVAVELALHQVATDGRLVGELVLPGVTAIDFEDLAAGPCPDRSGPCLWVADVGDNGNARASVAVYAVAEPDVDRSASFGSIDASRVWRLPFTLEGGPGDVEAVVLLPDASALVLFQKTNDAARIHRLAAPYTEDVVAVAALRGTFNAPGTGQSLRLVTGADLHPTGTRLLLRTYQALFEADLGDGVAVDGVTQSDFVEVLRPLEAQGEAACYDEDGSGVWTVSEQVGVGGFTLPNPLNHAVCGP